MPLECQEDVAIQIAIVVQHTANAAIATIRLAGLIRFVTLRRESVDQYCEALGCLETKG